MRPRQMTLPRTVTAPLAMSIFVAVMLAALAILAMAASTPTQNPHPATLNQVITNITIWIRGLLGGLATLLATIGGVR